jgi:hypothetical protein
MSNVNLSTYFLSIITIEKELKRDEIAQWLSTMLTEKKHLLEKGV